MGLERMSSPLTAQDVLTAGEVAELLRMPTSTVEHLARRGTLPSRKIGRRRLYVRQQIESVVLEEGLVLKYSRIDVWGHGERSED